MRRQVANRQVSQENTAVAPRYPQPVNLEKLTGQENWRNWRYLVKLHLEQYRLDDCIVNRTPAEELADRDSEGAIKDKAVQSIIGFHLHPNLLQLVSQAETAFDAWNALCSAFENQGVQRRLTLIYKLFDLKRSNYDSLEKYVLDAKEVVAQVRNSGISLDDEIAAANVLRNLRPEDSIMRRFVESSCTKADAAGNPVLNFDSVIQELFREAQRAAAEEPDTKAALKATVQESKPDFYGGRGRGRGRGRGARRGRGGRGRGGRGAHHQGHSDRFGYQNKSNQQGSTPFPPCRHCQKTNHTEEYCWFKDIGMKRRMEREEQQSKEPRKDSTVRFEQGPSSGGRSHQKEAQGHGPKGGWVLKVAKRPGDSCGETPQLKDRST